MAPTPETPIIPLDLVGNEYFPNLFRIFRVMSSLPFAPAIIPMLFVLAPGMILSFATSSYYYDLITSRTNPNFSDPSHYDIFDFIVVGGGSAGAVVANRLSRHSRVLLLEAGGNPHPLTAIPVANSILLNQPPIDWLYETVPQQNSSFAFNDHKIRWPRGRSLGGSSTLNNMIYMRGNPKDFDRWAELSGGSTWKYDHLLPFFKKLETYQGHFPNGKYHGNDGPVHVEKMRFTQGTDEWLAAGRELGYEVRDQNAGQYQGFSDLDVTMKTGTRFDTYRAYLKPLQSRKNLHIYKYALAFKIHLDRDRNAYGVSYYRHGIQKFVRASKEVIICAGTIGSAHLLMLSGIGPKKHLNSKEVKCRVNLPVGQNLQDHLAVNIGPYTIKAPISLISDRDVSFRSVLEYFFQGKGPMVSSSGLSGTAFISSSMAKPSWPDILLLLVGSGLHRTLGADQEKSLNFKPGILEKYYEPSIGKDANFVTVMVGKPKSRGELTLKDNYPFNKPLLNPRYLNHPDDMQVLTEGAKFVNNLYENTSIYQSLGAQLAPNAFPGCENHILKSDGYWECYIRFNAFTLHHQCGTCRMGKGRRDPTAVVNSKLRVLKTRGLRVIDASIIPEVTNGNLNIPVIMIGEKGSFEIRQYWARQFLVCLLREYLIDRKIHQKKCFYAQHI